MNKNKKMKKRGFKKRLEEWKAEMKENGMTGMTEAVTS